MNKRLAAGVIAIAMAGTGVALSAPALAAGTTSVAGAGFANVTATVTNKGSYLLACGRHG